MIRVRLAGVWVAALLPFAVGCAVQPWVADRLEQQYQHDTDYKTPVMPPIRNGQPAPRCEDAPSDLEVMRVFNERKVRGVPYIYEDFDDDLVIVKNLVADRIDPPRFFPLVGMAQLHHCKWECGVYSNNLKTSAYPYPLYIKKPKVEVIYIDKDHLHLYVGENPDTQRETLLEMTKWR